jgi:hypothetical protein
MNIFVMIEQQQKGPYTPEQIRDLIASGQLRSSDLAWREGLPEWQPLVNWPEFSDLARSVEQPPGPARKSGSRRTLGLAVLAGGIVLWCVLGWFIWKGCSTKSSRTNAGMPTDKAGIQASASTDLGLPRTVQELNAWYEEPPAGENAALVILQGCEQMHLDAAVRNSPVLPIVGKGVMPPLSDPLPGSMRTAVSSLVQRNAAALELFQKGAAGKKFRYPMDITQGMLTQLPHLAKLKQAAQLASLAAIESADSRKPERAVDLLLTALGIAQSLEYEPMLISQLVRVAAFSLACNALEQVVNRVALPPASLDRLKQALQRAESEESQGIGFHRALAGERVMGMSLFDLPPEELKRQLVAFEPNSPIWKSDQFYSEVKKQLPADRAHIEQTYRRIFAARKEAFPGRLQTVGELNSQSAQSARKKLPLSGMLIPALAPGLNKEVLLAARLRLASVAAALEHYRAAHSNRYPDSLPELAPAFLDAVPTDPYTGGSFRFRKVNSGYTLSSTGPEDNRADERTLASLTFSVVFPP